MSGTTRVPFLDVDHKPTNLLDTATQTRFCAILAAARGVAMSLRRPFGLRTIFVFSFALAVCAKPAAAPQAPTKDTIRVQAAEVVVDAIVTDKHNRIVTNLGADDFVVYEDG